MKFPFASVVLGAAMLAASAGAALAVPVYATVDSPIYSEKSTSSPQAGVMPRGSIGEGQCDAGWCFVDMPQGVDGWVNASTLDNPPTHDPALERQQAPGGGGFAFPDFNFDFNVNPAPQPPPDDFEDEAGVCFYDRAGFAGRSFCAGAGDYADRLGSWEDRISSIEVFGGAEVELCSGQGMGGSCAVFGRDTSRLPSRLNDRISSFEIY
jgi:hypothetical protein